MSTDNIVDLNAKRVTREQQKKEEDRRNQQQGITELINKITTNAEIFDAWHSAEQLQDIRNLVAKIGTFCTTNKHDLRCYQIIVAMTRALKTIEPLVKVELALLGGHFNKCKIPEGGLIDIFPSPDNKNIMSEIDNLSRDVLPVRNLIDLQITEATDFGFKLDKSIREKAISDSELPSMIENFLAHSITEEDALEFFYHLFDTLHNCFKHDNKQIDRILIKIMEKKYLTLYIVAQVWIRTKKDFETLGIPQIDRLNNLEAINHAISYLTRRNRLQEGNRLNRCFLESKPAT